MTRVRVPLRLTLAGGGTDVPEWYREHGGLVVAATINRYLTVSEGGHVESDVRPGSGLGGSGAATVGRIKAQYPTTPPRELATAAYNVERYYLGQPCGLQDHYIAAYGGCRALEIDTDGTVEVTSVALPGGFNERLALFATGIQRAAGPVLIEQVKNHSRSGAMLELAAIGTEIYRDLLHNAGRRFGELTEQHWLAKRRTAGATTTPEIDRWHAMARANGAEGGKCCGAGAGGYMLFVCEPDAMPHLIETMIAAGLTYTPFQFVANGAELIK